MGYGGDFALWANGSRNIRLLPEDGSVLVVGDVDVQGGSVKVDGSALTVPDEVFASDHQLTPLIEVAEYVAANGHLPDVPSEEDIHRDGLDMAQFQMVLLKKIEETTPYILDQQSDIDGLRTRVEELEATQRSGR